MIVLLLDVFFVQHLFHEYTLLFYKKLRSGLSTESFLSFYDFEYSEFLDSFLTCFLE